AVPADAFTTSDFTAAGGSLKLNITQVDPPTGAIAGGYGQVILGTYLLQTVDAQGHLAATGPRTPVTVTVHVGPKPPAVDFTTAFASFNAGLPLDLPLVPLSGGGTATIDNSDFGTPSTQAATFDATAQTLSTTATLSTASTSLNFGATSPIATFG